MTNSPATKPFGRSDLIIVVVAVALVAATLLIPVTRDFVLTNIDTVFGAIFDAGYAVGQAVAHAARFVASLFGSAA